MCFYDSERSLHDGLPHRGQMDVRRNGTPCNELHVLHAPFPQPGRQVDLSPQPGRQGNLSPAWPPGWRPFPYFPSPSSLPNYPHYMHKAPEPDPQTLTLTREQQDRLN